MDGKFTKFGREFCATRRRLSEPLARVPRLLGDCATEAGAPSIGASNSDRLSHFISESSQRAIGRLIPLGCELICPSERVLLLRHANEWIGAKASGAQRANMSLEKCKPDRQEANNEIGIE